MLIFFPFVCWTNWNLIRFLNKNEIVGEIAFRPIWRESVSHSLFMKKDLDFCFMSDHGCVKLDNKKVIWRNFVFVMMIKMFYCLICNNLQTFEGIGQKILCWIVFNRVLCIFSIHGRCVSVSCQIEWNMILHRQFSCCPDINQNSGWFKGTSTVFGVVILCLICHESEINFTCVCDVLSDKLDLLWYFFFYHFLFHWLSIEANRLSNKYWIYNLLQISS